MANSILNHTDAEIMHALLTHDFADIDREFVDDVVTKIKTGAFYAATNLDTVRLPAVTQVGHFAFKQTQLTTLELTWAALTFIGYEAFSQGWHRLPETLSLPNVTVLGQGAFAGTSSAHNTRLQSITMAKWTGEKPDAMAYSSNNAGIFDYCTALTTVNLPELTTGTTYMFRGCTALQEITLPKAQSLTTGTFQGCTSLKKADIGGAITSMNTSWLPTGNVFESLILRGVTTVPTLNSGFFRSTSIANGTGYVYVPKSLESLFKVATNWTTYAAQIRAIEDYPDVCGS